MSERRRLMVRYFEELESLAPRGYSVGLHIRFASPTFLHSTYPQEWQDLYLQNAYGLRDPLVFWGIGKTGVTRWSETSMPDPFGILEKGAGFGLRFGAVASCGQVTSRSMVGVAREDREFTDDELAEVQRLTQALHEVAEPMGRLPDDVREALRAAARREEATAVGVGPENSPAGHEARLAEARDLLGARTTAEAIRMARYHRLL